MVLFQEKFSLVNSAQVYPFLPKCRMMVPFVEKTISSVLNEFSNILVIIFSL